MPVGSWRGAGAGLVSVGWRGAGCGVASARVRRGVGVSVVSVSRWSEWSGASSTAAYDERWRRKAARGESIHGEADLLCWFEPGSVLDAGCGTGRVAVELDRRGVDVVGVDLDPRMLAEARRKAPHLRWVEADLCDVTVAADGAAVPRGFDVVALAGNVMIFVEPGTEAAVVANMARHLRDGGRLVAARSRACRDEA